jgi:hypothetical protein
MIVRGTAMWASVFDGHPNALSGKYQIDICNLEDETVTELEESGVTVKTDEHKGMFVTAKGKYPPKVMDSAKSLWDKDDRGVIGNGSTVKASCRPYPWTFKGTSGMGLGLNQLMVLKHVMYEEDLEAEDTDFDDEVVL